MQSVVPLQVARVQPGDYLLIVTCDYVFSANNKTDALEDHLVLADDTVNFDLIVALGTEESPRKGDQ